MLKMSKPPGSVALPGSGCSSAGELTGDWTTYDKQGEVYKVTRMKPKTPTGTVDDE
jgi:hypothetical protein